MHERERQRWQALFSFLVLPLQVLEGIVRLPIALHDTLVAIERKALVEEAAAHQRIHTEQSALLANHALVVSTLWSLGTDYRNDARRIADSVVSRYPKIAAPTAVNLAEEIKKRPGPPATVTP